MHSLLPRNGFDSSMVLDEKLIWRDFWMSALELTWRFIGSSDSEGNFRTENIPLQSSLFNPAEYKIFS